GTTAMHQLRRMQCSGVTAAQLFPTDKGERAAFERKHQSDLDRLRRQITARRFCLARHHSKNSLAAILHSGTAVHREALVAIACNRSASILSSSTLPVLALRSHCEVGRFRSSSGLAAKV